MGSITILAGDRESLPQWRSLYAEWDNILASPGGREDIPWADGRFDLIIDAQPGQPSREMLRVLAPGGSIAGLQDLADAL